MLARNSDVDGAVISVRDVEDRFNRKFGYPWVFMNEEPFSEDFKKWVLSLPPSLGGTPVLLDKRLTGGWETLIGVYPFSYNRR